MRAAATGSSRRRTAARASTWYSAASRWTAVRDEDSTVAAVTVIAVPCTASEVCYQQDTFVLPELRRESLAAVFKALIISDLEERRPDVRMIFTHIDHANEAMLRTNASLGFRADGKVARFEAPVAELAQYLAFKDSHMYSHRRI
jgi:RimJ/RimL family protein N-acetyltransferase